MASKPRVKVPKKASAGEIITIKTLISHEMESGLRKNKEGALIPRKIINKFTAEFNGQLVYSVDIHAAVSANPYLEFTVKVNESGTFKFSWVDDDGTIYTDEQPITVG
jgi:sulfur-oxidizing protein SoxZ